MFKKLLQKRLFNERGLSTAEMLILLGMSVILIGGTFYASRQTIIDWWNTSVAIYW
jgi:hypothetical protein